MMIISNHLRMQSSSTASLQKKCFKWNATMEIHDDLKYAITYVYFSPELHYHLDQTVILSPLHITKTFTDWSS